MTSINLLGYSSYGLGAYIGVKKHNSFHSIETESDSNMTAIDEPFHANPEIFTCKPHGFILDLQGCSVKLSCCESRWRLILDSSEFEAARVRS